MLANDLLKDKTVNFLTLFQNQVKLNSNKFALVYQEKKLTYKQLDLTSHNIARLIQKNNADAKLVVLLLSNPLSQISGMIGVLKSGFGYLPMDPSYPEETNKYILKDSGAKLILTEAEQMPVIAKMAIGSEITILDIKDAEVYALDSKATLNPTMDLDDYSYILYTSGSTGQPKGVAHNHRNLLHLLSIYRDDIRITESDRFTYLYSYSFSAGIKDVFAPLACGATIYPYLIKKDGMKKLISHLRENRLTIYHSVPTVFRHLCAELAKENVAFPHLRLISLGSETITKKDFQLYTKYFTEPCRLHIEYGITETGVITQYFLDHNTPLDLDRIPVGFPVFGKIISFITTDREESRERPNPPEAGEIVVQSLYLAKGYWKQGKLIPLKAVAAQNGQEVKVFRTGDLGRRHAKGVLEHLGRIDNQLKIRGYKVNLSELETVLNNLELIKEAVVIPKVIKDGDNSLVAFVVIANGNQCNVLEVIKEILRKTLPEYMIPARFVKIDQIPKLSNGKNDRQKLIGELENFKEELKSYSHDLIEEAIALIYADILEIRDFTVNDSVFELGGNSIKVSQIFGTIEDLFQIDFPVAQVFNHPSVSGLAGLIKANCGTKNKLEARALQIIEMANHSKTN